ncbi:MAG: AMP-binding protein, partial [Propionibacteriaceae bacterium]|nr:AMP-binding protein [Propionibacteriaceae bacterium]
MVYRTPTASTEAIRKARDFLFAHATDYDGAIAGFEWPQLEEFNFALDWFDVIAGEHPDRNAIMIANESGEVNSWTYGDLSGRSDQVANWFVSLGMKRGDSVIVMLPNTIELWETILGVIKAGGVVIPTYTLLSPEDIAQRAHRAHA